MKKNMLCELEVRYRHKKRRERIQVTKSHECVRYFRRILSKEILIREVFVAIYLNYGNYIIGYHICSIGSRSGTLVDNKVILTTGLLCGASKVVVAHNHPSGITSPSEADREMTRKLVNGCAAVDLLLLDSLIITEMSHYSFADEGELPKSTI